MALFSPNEPKLQSSTEPLQLTWLVGVKMPFNIRCEQIYHGDYQMLDHKHLVESNKTFLASQTCPMSALVTRDRTSSNMFHHLAVLFSCHVSSVGGSGDN